MKTRSMSSCLLMAGLAGAAVAAPARADETLALEEVIVTAQKKEESLQDAPISLAAFGAEDLEEQGVSNISDLQIKVPNLKIDAHPTSSSTLRVYIRGVGTNDTTITLEPSVGVYQDGVYIARATGLAMDIADLERLEVLRGPQGTLYGRNSTGGAINLVTQKPSLEEMGGYLKWTAGSRNLNTVKGSVNLPLADRFAVKLSYLSTEQDGHTENTGPGADFGDKQATGYRFDALWDISDSLSARLIYDKSELEFVNYLLQAITPATNDGSSADQIRDHAVANSFISSERADKLASFAPMLPSDTEIEGYSLHLSHTGESYELRSITAFRTLDNANYIELGGGAGSGEYRLDNGAYDFRAPIDLATGRPPESLPAVRAQMEHEQLSQELQLLGTLGSRVDYVVGAYYFTEQGNVESRPEHHTLSGKIANPMQPTFLVSTASGVLLEIDNDAWALFGQFTWTPPLLEDRLRLTLGYRHSEDTKEARKRSVSKNYIDNSVALVTLSETRFDETGSKDFRDDSLSFVASYDLNDDINLYAKASEAYKGGGFNIREPDATVFRDGFDEENVLSYELGVKSELFGRRLRVNANVFQTASENLQMTFKLPGATDTRILNVGESEIRGAELDLTWLVLRGLTAVLNYAYLDAEITEAKDENGVDRKDEFQLGQTPRHTAGINLNWRVLSLDFGNLESALSYNYVDDTTVGATTKAARRGGGIDGYGLLSARLALRDIPLGGTVTGDIALWGRNLTDEDYEVTVLAQLPHANRSVFWGDPRSVGVDLKLIF